MGQARRRTAPWKARAGDQRLYALCLVALFVLSCGLLADLSSQSAAGRPTQSLAWVFGPAPAVDAAWDQ